MKLLDLIFLTIVFMTLSYIDSKINLYLYNLFVISNITYLFLCHLCFKNPQKINPYFAAYIGFLIDLNQSVFFGLHATLFTLTILVVNYNYYRLRMFSKLQIAITFSLFTSFYVGFKSILLSTMNFQYLIVFLSFFLAFFSYLLVPTMVRFFPKQLKI